MKTRNYTFAMLIALVFAVTTIQAQSARRPATQEKKERARTSTTYKAKSTQPEQKAQSPQVRTQNSRNSQPARKAQNPQVRTQNSRISQPARKAQSPQVRTQNSRTNEPARTVQTQRARKPASMSTTNNPRSTYRKPNNKVTTQAHYNPPVKSKVYNNRGYYGGHHYHYAYPTRKVKFHYHHDTYINHYHVLYYPSYGHIYWTRNMYRDYRRWYPEFHWSYNYGHRIQMISVFDAKYNLGEVAMVYGRVYATWYNNETDDYLLFFGGDFPYQQFTVVVPGNIARKYSWRPEKYFLGEHITTTGLITTFDGSPEIVVKNRGQLDLY